MFKISINLLGTLYCATSLFAFEGTALAQIKKADAATQIKVTESALLVDRQAIADQVPDVVHNAMKPTYDSLGFPSGMPIYIGMEKDGKKLFFKDKNTYPSADGTSTELHNLTAKISQGSVKINNVSIPNNSVVPLTSCGGVNFSGVTDSFGVIGSVVSHIRLEREGATIYDKATPWFGLTGLASDAFSFQFVPDSGNYRVRHVVYMAGIGALPLWNDSDFSFQIQNTSSCPAKVQYRGHVKGIGWMGFVSNGVTTGTTGQNRRMEAIEISLISPSPPGLSICYNRYVGGILDVGNGLGWQGKRCNGTESGTTGQNRPINNLQINLENNTNSGCSVQYRVHRKGVGWHAWVSNGANAAPDNSKRIEAVEVKTVGC